MQRIYTLSQNFFQGKITSGSVVEVSEGLKQIVSNNALNNTDVVLVTSVVEKITDSLKVTQKNENQVRFCSDLYLEDRYCPFLSYISKMLMKNYLSK